MMLSFSLYLDVLDSRIEAESVPALVAFFADMFVTCKHFDLIAWERWEMVPPDSLEPQLEAYRERWYEIRTAWV